MAKIGTDGSVWHTDIESVRTAIRGLPFLVKYGSRAHVDAWVNSGSLRISNALSYAAETSADRRDRRDDQGVRNRRLRKR